MEEDVFKSVYRGYDPQGCHFGKAILTRCAGCSRSQRVLIAEREAISCLSRAGHQRCGAFLPLLRAKSVFALGLTQQEQNLPHGKEMKVQCGGVGALAELVGGNGTDDIDGLLQAAERRFGSFGHLPYAEIVRFVSRHTLRRRSGR